MQAARYCPEMTAKEQPRKRIETLSGEEAGQPLHLFGVRADPEIACFPLCPGRRGALDTTRTSPGWPTAGRTW